MGDIIKKILKKIKQYDTIVIARHISPDPDAICSQIALRDAILENYPKKHVYAIGSGVSKFKKYGSLDKIDLKTLSKVLLITLDVPNLYRVDGLENISYKEIIKIDHHPFEEDFKGIEWINEQASSTCQMVAQLLLKSNYSLSDKVASNLFIGIVSDSHRFLLPYTTLETFKIVSNLLERTNINMANLYEKLYERPLSEIRFHGYISDNLKVTPNGLAYIIISHEDIEKYQVDVSTASNMVNDFNYIIGVYVWTFVTYDEKNDLYRVNIRSKGPVINTIASKYNGGGHKFASGVKTNNKDDITALLKDLDLECHNFHSAK